MAGRHLRSVTPPAGSPYSGLAGNAATARLASTRRGAADLIGVKSARLQRDDLDTDEEPQRTSTGKLAGFEKAVTEAAMTQEALKRKYIAARFGAVGLKLMRRLLLLPFEAIDQLSAVDLHAKDAVNYMRSGKTLEERANQTSGQGVIDYSKQTQKRKYGRTGTRAYLAGKKYHQMVYGKKMPSDLPWAGKHNPVVFPDTLASAHKDTTKWRRAAGVLKGTAPGNMLGPRTKRDASAEPEPEG